EEDIDRITVLTPRSGEVAEVVRKRHPLGQNLAQPPDAPLLIELVFVAGAFRRIDHHVQAFRIGVDWRQFLNWCHHPYTPIQRAVGLVQPSQGCKDNAANSQKESAIVWRVPLQLMATGEPGECGCSPGLAYNEGMQPVSCAGCQALSRPRAVTLQ